MMQRTRERYVFFLLACLVSHISFAQKPKSDTLDGRSDDVVITATRTERKLSNIAVPAIVVGQKQILQSGSLRLNDILQEQTGLFVTSGTGSGAVGGGVFGNGIQLQGLSADYTMILLDGEPLIGRQGGVMDLSRFAVGNIRKIEIIKGPASSLYGSEAMGGVINIITEPISGTQTQIGARYGSFATQDYHVSGSSANEKNQLYYFFNRNSSAGYELDPNTPERTLDPFFNYTAQLKYTHKFNRNTKLTWNNRYFYGKQESFYAINSREINVGGHGTTNDFTINPVLHHQFSDRIKNRLSLVASGFHFVQDLDSLNSKANYYYDSFRQNFWRAENQTDIQLGNHMLTVGGGYTLQSVLTTRYREQKFQHIWHAFVQDEWKVKDNLSLIAGLRYDNNTDFASRLSPKFALHWQLNDQWTINSSIGAGFKAPDFRQLYLSFVNNAADGYSIFGASEFSVAELQRQQSIGLIAQILPAAFAIQELQPEISQGFNFAVQFRPKPGWKAEVNVFRNDINNLINFIPVATNNNGSSVFSYINVNRAFTQGIEGSLDIKFAKYWNLSAGYQFLQTADKQILGAVKAGEVFGRDREGAPARLMRRSDYSGLLNRSAHMANARLFWDHTPSGWMASLRAIYRSRWGVIDRDGNGFANRPDEFAEGMIHVNLTLTKRVKENWMIQFGINNLLNQTNAMFMPNMPGTNWFTTVTYTFKHKNK